jgi:hypothetical protein
VAASVRSNPHQEAASRSAPLVRSQSVRRFPGRRLPRCRGSALSTQVCREAAAPAPTPGSRPAWACTQHCEHYRRFAKSLKRSMHQQHRAGEKLFADFAGPRLPLETVALPTSSSPPWARPAIPSARAVS